MITGIVIWLVCGLIALGLALYSGGGMAAREERLTGEIQEPDSALGTLIYGSLIVALGVASLSVAAWIVYDLYADPTCDDCDDRVGQ